MMAWFWRYIARKVASQPAFMIQIRRPPDTPGFKVGE